MVGFVMVSYGCVIIISVLVILWIVKYMGCYIFFFFVVVVNLVIFIFLYVWVFMEN